MSSPRSGQSGSSDRSESMDGERRKWATGSSLMLERWMVRWWYGMKHGATWIMDRGGRAADEGRGFQDCVCFSCVHHHSRRIPSIYPETVSIHCRENSWGVYTQGGTRLVVDSLEFSFFTCTFLFMLHHPPCTCSLPTCWLQQGPIK